MKKILFNDKFCLTQAVLDGTKTMTRRAVTMSLLDEYDAWYEDFIYKPIGEEDCYLSTDEYVLKRTTHKVGDIVAIAQPYNDIIERLPMYSDAILDEVGMPRKEYKAGWTNKMFVRADLLPHHIRITDVKVEYLQNISDDEILREGIYPQRFFNKVEYVFSTKGKLNNTPVHRLKIFPTPREAFAALIDKISGKGTWESNPWVVAYSFELVD